MPVDPIARAGRSPVSLLGGTSAKEFADREFPREDVHWVVAQIRAAVTAPVTPSRRGRLRRLLGTPERAEPSTETAPEPAPA